MTRKRCFLLALALAGPGCLGPMTHLDEEAHKMPAPVPVVMTPAPPIVTPDEVTDANAGEKARALAQELDYAANERPAALPRPAVKETATKP
jgi:hypothetical protein